MEKIKISAFLGSLLIIGFLVSPVAWPVWSWAEEGGGETIGATNTDPVVEPSLPDNGTSTEVAESTTTDSGSPDLGASLMMLSLPLIPLLPPTPTAILSTYTISNLLISPDNISSTGDLDDTSIDLAFSGAVSVSLDILDSLGKEVKHLYDSASVTNPTAKIWNGKDDTNNFVADGAYTVQVVYSDAGGTATNTSKTITVDNTSPVVGPVSIIPSYNDGFTNYVSALSTIAASSSDFGTGISSTTCQYSVDGGASSAIVVPTAYDATVSSCIFSAIDTSAATGVAVSVKDLAGNQFDTSSSWVTVTPDLLAPVTTIKALTGQADYVSGEETSKPVEISLSASDGGSGLANIYYSLDNGANYSVYTGSIILTEAGEYKLKFYAVDNVGNKESEQSFLVTIKSSTAVSGGGTGVLGGALWLAPQGGLVLGTSTTIHFVVKKLALSPEQKQLLKMKKKYYQLKSRLYDLKHPGVLANLVPATSTVSIVVNGEPTSTATSTKKKPFWMFW